MGKNKERHLDLGKLAVDVVFPKLFNAQIPMMFTQKVKNDLQEASQIYFDNGSLSCDGSTSLKDYLDELPTISKHMYHVIKFKEVPSVSEKNSFFRNMFDLDKILKDVVAPEQLQEAVDKMLPVVIGAYYNLINKQELSKFKTKREDNENDKEVVFSTFENSYFKASSAPEYLKMVAVTFVKKPFKETSEKVKHSLYRMIFQLQEDDVDARVVNTALIDSFVKTGGDLQKAKEHILGIFKGWVDEHANGNSENLKCSINKTLSSNSFGPFKEAKAVDEEIIKWSGSKANYASFNAYVSWFMSGACTNFYNQCFYKAVVSDNIFEDVTFKSKDASLKDKILTNLLQTHHQVAKQPNLNLTVDWNSLLSIAQKIEKNPVIKEKAVSYVLLTINLSSEEQEKALDVLKTLSPKKLQKELEPAVDSLKNRETFNKFFAWAKDDELFQDCAKVLMEKNYNRFNKMIDVNLSAKTRNAVEEKFYDFYQTVSSSYAPSDELSIVLKCMAKNEDWETSPFICKYKEKNPDLFHLAFKEFVSQLDTALSNKKYDFVWEEQNCSIIGLFSSVKTPVETLKQRLLNQHMEKITGNIIVDSDEDTSSALSFKL